MGQIAEVPLRGVVQDPAGQRLPGVEVRLLSAQQITVNVTRTDTTGAFQLSGPRGSYVLRLRKSQFAEREIAVTATAAQDVGTITMPLAPVSSAVSVSVDAGRVAEEGASAQPVTVMGHGELRARVATVLSEALQYEPGVATQRTSATMGGIFVRGMTGKNVATYVDGVRYTTSVMRGGVNTFLNLNDVTTTESVEILRGPSSAQYGSDSLGGALQVLTRVPGVGGEPEWHGELGTLYASASNAVGGNALASYNGRRFGLMSNLSALRSNTVRTGGGVDSHAAVTRFLGLRAEGRLPDTGFTQYGGMLRAQYRLSDRQHLSALYQRQQQDGGKRYDQLLGGDGNLIADLRNLMLDFGYLRYLALQVGPFDQVSVTGSFNAQREERINQGGQGNPLGDITNQYEKTKSWGVQFAAQKQWRAHDLLLGGDGYRETVAAPSFVYSPRTLAFRPVRGRVPDGARYLLYSLFAQDVWKVSPRLQLSGAVRFGGASYRSRAANALVVGGRPLFPDDSLAANTVTGRLGAVYTVAPLVRVRGNYSRGFRAPNITDLGTVGLQGNGAFEASFADLAGRGATVGGQPVAAVRPELSDNFDAGLRLGGDRFLFDAGAFWMRLRDSIVSQPLVLPAGAIGLTLGDQVVNRQTANGQVFVPISTSAVLVRTNAAAVDFRGVEQRLQMRLTRSLMLRENFTIIYARDRSTGLPPDIEGGVPPATGNLSLLYAPAGKRFWVEAYGVLAGRQDRISPLSLADRRIGAARSRANIASFFNNGATARGLVRNGVLVATGETLAQVQNRVLGTLDSAPLFAAIPGYGVFGARAGWSVTERSDLLFDFSNLTDKNYRGLSWGMDAPGIGVTARWRYRF